MFWKVTFVCLLNHLQIKKNKKTVYYIDGYIESYSNWMRYVNCARHEDEQNVLAYQHKGEIYYRTFNKILENTEILVWYGEDYGIQLGITAQKFRDPLKRHISGVLIFISIYIETHTLQNSREALVLLLSLIHI